MTFIKKFLLITVITTACDTDELRDYSINPQTVNQIDLNYLFTPSLLSAASGGAGFDNNRYIDWRTNIGMCAYAIQHLATDGFNAPGDKYLDRPGTMDFMASSAPFQVLYNSVLKNLAVIIRETGPEGYDVGNKNNLRNAARILRAFTFARLTDYYGNTPYFDALKGASDERVFFPKYDSQKEIYTDILRELDEATAELNTPDPEDGFATADIVYNGDVSAWRKWGYSLMLRAAMRISNVDVPLAETYIAKALNGGVFTSNNDNAWVPMSIGPDQWINQNGISRALTPGDGNQPSILSKTLVDFLKGADPNTTTDDDPRLMIISGGIAIWQPGSWRPINIDPLAQKGMPNGLDPFLLQQYEGTAKVINRPDSVYSRINYRMLQRDEPYMLMNYGEVELLLAEASHRGLAGLNPADAETHYNNGVKASMQMYTPYDATLVVSDAQVTDYLALYSYGVSKPPLEMIGEQLWVNHFFNWWEAWSDWRRTGFPVLTPTNYPNNVTNGIIPQRLKYPAEEASGNPNFQTGATQLDNLTTRLWFAGGPG